MKTPRKRSQKLLPAIEPTTERYCPTFEGWRCVEDDGCVQTWQSPRYQDPESAEYTRKIAPYRHPRSGLVHALYSHRSWKPAHWSICCRVGHPLPLGSEDRTLDLDAVDCQPCLASLGIKNRAALALERTQALIELYGKERLAHFGKEVWVLPPESRALYPSTAREVGFLLAYRFPDGWWEVDGLRKGHRLHGTIIRYLRELKRGPT